MATTLYLVRHAAHDRVGDTLCGRMPGVTLGPDGERQADGIAQRLAAKSIAAVFSSPLERAIATAEPIARRLELSVQVADALNEINFGTWTGRRFDALAADPGWTAWNRVRSSTRPPGGEDFFAAQNRIVPFLKELAAKYPDDGVVAVTHCDLIRAALCAFLDCRSVDDFRLFEISPATVTTLVMWSDGWKVLGMNEAIAA